ncbi:MAG TPA: hypothetical protein VG056_06800, partial [Pirellulales bacterium]|nr:hypothetical protein [Pirellulales bacterium]
MMRSRVWLRASALALAAVGFSFTSNIALAQGPIQIREPAVRVAPDQSVPSRVEPSQAASPQSAPTLTAAVDDVVSRGAKLEDQRRWGEALSLYEDFVRTNYDDYVHANPSITQLAQRIDLAKIHYDLGRRYADGSYRRSIAQLDEPQALDLYTEVLAKVYAHYVQEPDWKHMLDRGTLDLDVALNEPTFAAGNPIQGSPETVNDFRRRLHNLTDNRAVRDRDELRDVVASAAHLARAELGLSPTSVILEYTAGAAGGL